MTTSTLTRLAPTQVEIEIEITAQELAAAEERAFRKLVKNVRLPGFRQGKVPRKVFEQTYGAASITSEAIDEIVPEVYAQAIREHDLVPVDRPKMEWLDEAQARPSRFKATVDVRPAIELGQYKGVEIERHPIEVTDRDVEQSLASLAKDRATLVPVERPAQLGDVITMDYTGSIDGVPFEGGSAEQQTTELSAERFIPGFASGIAGMRAGETKDVEAQFPEQYSQSELAGKQAVFAITLHDVKQYELPPIDDEFAKSLSQHETLDELRADVRKRLEAMAQGRTRDAIGNAVMDRLMAAHDFALPAILVEREVDQQINDAAASVSRSGESFETYLAQSGKTEDELRSSFEPDARKRVKGTLLIEAIARAEKIAATPADISAELLSLSRQYGQPVDAIRKALGNNLLSLMDGIARNKTIEFLIDNATLIEPK